MTDPTLDDELLATVFVFRERHTRQICCEYLQRAKILEKLPQWEHLATVNPRLWIQAHWLEVEN